MAFGAAAAARIRAHLAGRDGLVEKQMFGGVGWLLGGHMAVGLHQGARLIVRVGAADEEAALAEPHTARFAPTGRPMRGWIEVAPEGWADDGSLASWVDWGLRFAAALPAKP